jgi:hypothetical protein
MGGFIFRTLIGLAIIALGFSMIWKTEWYLRILGMNMWAEQTFGGGGSRFFYKLFGIVIILIGIIIVTDLWDNLMVWLVGSLFM